ncbi:DUF3231 family protein [Priestia megaterium]|uniref:DUF3231 family protein n=1 Tax=Priestia megaterium TaxID=1404 RepID=UPI003012E60E
MNAIESGHTYFNLHKTLIAKAMILGFSQVSKNKNVGVLLQKSLQVKNKHIDIFSSLLIKDNLHLPKSCQTGVTY